MRSLALASRYVLAAFLVMIGLGAPIVQASDVTWNYVGAPLDQCTIGAGCGPSDFNLPTTDFLSLTITFNGPLAASSFYDGNAPIKSWTMTDTAGFVDLSSTIGSPITQAIFSTDPNGNIVGPYSFLSFFNPATQDFPPQDICCKNLAAASTNYDVGITDINDQFLGFVSLTGVPGADFIQVYPNIYPSFYAACANQNSCNQEQYSLADGTWSLAPTATPLPSALPLLATGLGALGLLGWRRKRKNTAAVAA